MNEKHYAQMYFALQRIKHYQTPEHMKRFATREYGLDDPRDAIEMAYENVLHEAKCGLRGVRKPKPANS